MSKKVAGAILGLSNLLMAPLKARRRWLVRARAVEGFYQDISIETDLGPLKFHITNRQTLVIPIEFDAYEPETLEWIKGFPKGAVLWDIGANIGALSLYAALMPDTSVLAFEPAAATYAVLVKNIEVNTMAGRVFAYPLALSNETKCGSLNMATTEAGSFLHAFEDDTNVRGETIPVKFAQASVGISIDDFIRQAKEVLADKHPANMMLLRGFDQYHKIPTMPELYHLHCAAIATYPMYKGVARLVGMDIIEGASNLEEQVGLLENNWADHTFFYFHVKYMDSRGEDGDFEGRVKVAEEFDTLIPRIRALNPDVIVVTGDHSTPAKMKAHSFHPVPVSICAGIARKDDVAQFTEKTFIQGALGHIRGTDILPLALAHAGKLVKFGA